MSTAQPVAFRSSKRGPEWPFDGSVDVEARRSSGWKPAPFGQFLFKVATRCNLDCDYCYVYNLADTSWMRKPRFMSEEVLEAGLDRVREHLVSHGLNRASLVLHGGEPLLAGAAFIKRFARTARARLGDIAELRFTIQSNGTLVTPELLDVLIQENVVIGISLDGDRDTNDLHRRDRKGNSSYDRATNGIRLLRDPRWSSLLSGLLCTINLDADPMKVYEGLMEFDPPWLDLLLPHGTWDDPPPGKGDPMSGTPYADWLIPIFEHWFAQPSKPTSIRIFEELISLVLGGRTRYESFGLPMVNLIVIESDGTLEQVDSLKVAYDGAADTGLNVFDHSLDDALWSVPVIARQIGAEAMCQTCRDCELVSMCGAGLYPHRYRQGTGFLNPTVYCTDITKLIRHIAARVEEAILARSPRAAAERP